MKKNKSLPTPNSQLPTLLSGVQPTGRLHLGNYLGAIKNFVNLQNSGKYLCYFFIADYHSLTIDFDPNKKTEQVFNVIKSYLAAGINPEKSVIYTQSQIPVCTELAWILNTITPLGELERMTQFKEKAGGQKFNVNAGLFVYPTLMAADILLYNAKFVPVGEDQLQHLELARTLARKFNNKFGKIFIEPQALLTNSPRVMSLDNPVKKMSKSSFSGCLFLDESPEEIELKIKRSVTDSGREIKYDVKNKAGISNLLNIYSALTDETVKTIEKKYLGKTYSQFKTDLTEIIIKSLKPFRDIKISDSKLKTILEKGTKKARETASRKINQIKNKLGLLMV